MSAGRGEALSRGEALGGPRLGAAAVGAGAAGLVAGWLVGGLVLLLAGAYSPLPGLLLCVPLALAGAVVGARLARVDGEPRPLLPLALTLAMVAGFVAVAWISADQHVIVRRDPGTYAVATAALAQHGAIPFPAHADVFGSSAAVTPASPGFYARGEPPGIVPQFMNGLPILLAPAGWAGGIGGVLHGNAVLGGLALLAVAGVAARMVGPWAGPLAVAALGLTFPDLLVARETLSEPAAQLLLWGGLGLLATRAPRRSALAAGGLLAGLTVLVRVDALVELAFLLPVVGLLAAKDRDDGRALLGGLVAGAGLGILDGVVLSRPYLHHLAAQLGAAAGGWLVVGLASRWILRRRERMPRRVPDLVLGVVVAVAGLIAVRPLFLHEHWGYNTIVLRAERREGLPLDPHASFFEHSLQWLLWWVGPVAAALAVVGLAMLLRRQLEDVRRGGAPAAIAVTLVTLGAGALVLVAPDITPDHPWADRRLVPVVLPAVALGGCWLVRQLVLWARRGRGRLAGAAVAVAGVAALTVPAAVATAPLATAATQQGEVALLDRVCAALPPQPAVLVVGGRGPNELPESLRWRCGVPVATVVRGHTPDLGRIAAAARAHGRRLVVVGLEPGALRALGLTPHRVAHLSTTEPDRTLLQRPQADRPLTFDVWAATP